MKRKSITMLLILAMVLAMFAGCAPKKETFEIGLVTDVGTIDDKSFNQGAWEGVVQYANESKKTFKYYQPKSDAKDDLLASIGLAIDGGAKIVVCPGFNFEVAIYEAQTKYPKVNFILLDGVPHTADFKTFKTESNVKCISYAEQEAGFLAGYAVVKDGMTKLGFMGGMAVPAVIRFGYGFVQGADYAAKEMKLAAGAIEVNYNYTGKFAATPEAQTMAAGWFTNGTQVIFGCGGALGDSVMAAAATAKAKAIGVDVDRSSESPTVITSAMKNLTKSVYDSLKEYYAGKFAGGATLTVDVKSKGVGLPMATSKFTTFKQADYDAIYAKLVAGDIKILVDTDVDSAAKLTTTNVVVNEIK